MPETILRPPRRKTKQKEFKGFRPEAVKRIETAYNTLMDAKEEQKSAAEVVDSAKQEVIKAMRSAKILNYIIKGKRLVVSNEDKLKIEKA